MVATNIFDTILTEGEKRGLDIKAEASRNWFRTAAAKAQISPEAIFKIDLKKLTILPRLGHMYFFRYNPKGKDSLPYYDTYPLIFPFAGTKTTGPLSGSGFMGINFHYLPFRLRARLMDALHSLASDSNYDEKTRLVMTYKLLKKMSKARMFAPCVKHYLFTHVKSKFFYIDSKDWNVALFLPIQRFVGASATKVHRDSVNSLIG